MSASLSKPPDYVHLSTVRVWAALLSGLLL